MRALTIWQPWASAIAHGTKIVENRGWYAPHPWPYDFAIHAAAKRRSRDDEEEDLLDCLQWWPGAREADYPRGCVIAVATLVACRRNLWPEPQSRTITRVPWEVPGAVGWHLDNVRALAEPVSCRGQLGLWTLPPDVEAEVRRQLGAV